MKNTNRILPTALASLLIVITVIATTFLVRTGVVYFSKAAPSDTPQNVRISNISDTSISVTYTTDAKIIGSISIGQDKNTVQTILDERDQQSGTPQPYTVHSISVKNLKPSTQYIFSITSGTTTYLNNNAYFSTQTGPQLSVTPSSQSPLSGKILTPDGSIPEEALVYVTTDKGQLLSSLTNSSGIYTIPLNTFRSDDLSSAFAFSNDTPLHILATDGTSSSQATVLLSGSNPVPLITLSQTYNFVASTQPVTSDSAEAIGFPAFDTNKTLDATPLIIVPQKDESFTDAQPQFTGKALPNQSVTIEIHSADVITATVTTDAFGNWVYRPTTALAPGDHTITILTRDADGVLKSLQQSFTVYAEGTQLAQAPSISPTQPATPTPSPTPTPPLTNTPTPTIAPTPTANPTTLPTLQPTISVPPTPVTKITPQPSLPPTGSNSLVVLGTTGILTTLTGIIIFLISRGAAL